MHAGHQIANGQLGCIMLYNNATQVAFSWIIHLTLGVPHCLPDSVETFNQCVDASQTLLRALAVPRVRVFCIGLYPSNAID